MKSMGAKSPNELQRFDNRIGYQQYAAEQYALLALLYSTHASTTNSMLYNYSWILLQHGTITHEYSNKKGGAQIRLWASIH